LLIGGLINATTFDSLVTGGYHGGKNGPHPRLDLGQPSGPFDWLNGTIPLPRSNGGEPSGLFPPPHFLHWAPIVHGNVTIGICVLANTSAITQVLYLMESMIVILPPP
jgi:hypothetical protein